MKYILLLFISFLGKCATANPPAFTDSLEARYAFLNTNKNIILNDSVGLQNVYYKLLYLQESGRETVNIVHIGDSHIQADLFSGRVRQELHKAFGNAGRGLIFPYKIARTNEPWSYKTTSAATWQANRVISSDTTLPVGVSGITLKTTDSDALLTLKISKNPLLDYRFNKIRLLHQKGPQHYDWLITDASQNATLNILNTNASATGMFLSEYISDTLLTEICIKTNQSDSVQNCAQLYGIVLENNQPGILYHGIGINGAEFRHYNKSLSFTKQLQALKPDLVIISLGTNDAYQAGFDTSRFVLEMDSMVSRIRRQNPEADILLTTPPDSYRNRKYRNADMNRARNLILSYALEHNLACWDFYDVMGGYGSMLKWLQAGLAQKDKVHLTSKGYDIQGLLLYNAIKDGFERFAAARTE